MELRETQTHGRSKRPPAFLPELSFRSLRSQLSRQGRSQVWAGAGEPVECVFHHGNAEQLATVCVCFPDPEFITDFRRNVPKKV